MAIKNNSGITIGQQHLNAAINGMYDFEHASYKIAGFGFQSWRDLGLPNAFNVSLVPYTWHDLLTANIDYKIPYAGLQYAFYGDKTIDYSNLDEYAGATNNVFVDYYGYGLDIATVHAYSPRPSLRAKNGANPTYALYNASDFSNITSIKLGAVDGTVVGEYTEYTDAIIINDYIYATGNNGVLLAKIYKETGDIVDVIATTIIQDYYQPNYYGSSVYVAKIIGVYNEQYIILGTSAGIIFIDLDTLTVVKALLVDTAIPITNAVITGTKLFVNYEAQPSTKLLAIIDLETQDVVSTTNLPDSTISRSYLFAMPDNNSLLLYTVNTGNIVQLVWYDYDLNIKDVAAYLASTTALSYTFPTLYDANTALIHVEQLGDTNKYYMFFFNPTAPAPDSTQLHIVAVDINMSDDSYLLLANNVMPIWTPTAVAYEHDYLTSSLGVINSVAGINTSLLKTQWYYDATADTDYLLVHDSFGTVYMIDSNIDIVHAVIDLATEFQLPAYNGDIDDTNYYKFSNWTRGRAAVMVDDTTLYSLQTVVANNTRATYYAKAPITNSLTELSGEIALTYTADATYPVTTSIKINNYSHEYTISTGTYISGTTLLRSGQYTIPVIYETTGGTIYAMAPTSVIVGGSTSTPALLAQYTYALIDNTSITTVQYSTSSVYTYASNNLVRHGDTFYIGTLYKGVSKYDALTEELVQTWSLTSTIVAASTGNPIRYKRAYFDVYEDSDILYICYATNSTTSPGAYDLIVANIDSSGVITDTTVASAVTEVYKITYYNDYYYVAYETGGSVYFAQIALDGTVAASVSYTGSNADLVVVAENIIYLMYKSSSSDYYLYYYDFNSSTSHALNIPIDFTVDQIADYAMLINDSKNVLYIPMVYTDAGTTIATLAALRYDLQRQSSPVLAYLHGKTDIFTPHGTIVVTAELLPDGTIAIASQGLSLTDSSTYAERFKDWYGDVYSSGSLTSDNVKKIFLLEFIPQAIDVDGVRYNTTQTLNVITAYEIGLRNIGVLVYHNGSVYYLTGTVDRRVEDTDTAWTSTPVTTAVTSTAVADMNYAVEFDYLSYNWSTALGGRFITVAGGSGVYIYSYNSGAYDPAILGQTFGQTNLLFKYDISSKYAVVAHDHVDILPASVDTKELWFNITDFSTATTTMPDQIAIGTRYTAMRDNQATLYQYASTADNTAIELHTDVNSWDTIISQSIIDTYTSYTRLLIDKYVNRFGASLLTNFYTVSSGEPYLQYVLLGGVGHERDILVITINRFTGVHAVNNIMDVLPHNTVNATVVRFKSGYVAVIGGEYGAYYYFDPTYSLTFWVDSTNFNVIDTDPIYNNTNLIYYYDVASPNDYYVFIGGTDANDLWQNVSYLVQYDNGINEVVIHELAVTGKIEPTTEYYRYSGWLANTSTNITMQSSYGTFVVDIGTSTLTVTAEGVDSINTYMVAASSTAGTFIGVGTNPLAYDNNNLLYDSGTAKFDLSLYNINLYNAYYNYTADVAVGGTDYTASNYTVMLREYINEVALAAIDFKIAPVVVVNTDHATGTSGSDVVVFDNIVDNLAVAYLTSDLSVHLESTGSYDVAAYAGTNSLQLTTTLTSAFDGSAFVYAHGDVLPFDMVLDSGYYAVENSHAGYMSFYTIYLKVTYADSVLSHELVWDDDTLYTAVSIGTTIDPLQPFGIGDTATADEVLPYLVDKYENAYRQYDGTTYTLIPVALVLVPNATYLYYVSNTMLNSTARRNAIFTINKVDRSLDLEYDEYPQIHNTDLFTIDYAGIYIINIFDDIYYYNRSTYVNKVLYEQLDALLA